MVTASPQQFQTFLHQQDHVSKVYSCRSIAVQRRRRSPEIQLVQDTVGTFSWYRIPSGRSAGTGYRRNLQVVPDTVGAFRWYRIPSVSLAGTGYRRDLQLVPDTVGTFSWYRIPSVPSAGTGYRRDRTGTSIRAVVAERTAVPHFSEFSFTSLHASTDAEFGFVYIFLELLFAATGQTIGPLSYLGLPFSYNNLWRLVSQTYRRPFIRYFRLVLRVKYLRCKL